MEFFTDDGDCALHEAILEAGDHAAADAVSVALLIELGLDPAVITSGQR